MCGIAGILDPRGGMRSDELLDVATTMVDTLSHRGPDDGGAWADESAGVALASRRLAVVDLSHEGHQPMTSADGRWTITFNGEIYNHLGLRKRLEAEGARFRGHSDTEVLLTALLHWGLARTLSLLNGMYAIAAWDSDHRTLSLIRDRLGEKPLYYGMVDGALIFGSELKALRAVKAFSPTVDRRVLAEFFRLSRVPAPSSIYEGVNQLMPGSMLNVTHETCRRGQLHPSRYWSATTVACEGASNVVAAQPEALVDELEDLLGDAVALRLNADVPVGVFLSGGIDSSTVVALMRARTSGSVRSFTIGFDEAGYDESSHAREIARHLGTDHTEHRLTVDDAAEVISLLPKIYDEPFADASQIPTYLVSKLARRHVTVALSGDGGDELFGGYNRHVMSGTLRRVASRVPVPARRAAARLLAAPSPAAWDRLFRQISHLLPAKANIRIPGLKMQKLASVLPAATSLELYAALASTWRDPTSLVLGTEHGPSTQESWVAPPLPDVASEMMYLDLISYLPDDILVKLDRASMAVSLEARVPMLDHRVVEFAWRIPTSLKIQQGSGKWILRQLLARHVPPALFERAKAGFGLPIGAWMRGPLRPWAEGLLSPERLSREGYLRPGAVREVWTAHLAGRRDETDRLWAVLMFQAWLESHSG